MRAGGQQCWGDPRMQRLLKHHKDEAAASQGALGETAGNQRHAAPPEMLLFLRRAETVRRRAINEAP